MSMASAFVVDTSVLVAGIRPGEVHHATARTLLEALSRRRSPLFLPTIALAEVAASISRVTGDADKAHQEVTLLRQMPGVSLMPVDRTLGDRAAELAANHRIRGCDAVFVALAQQLNATLITLDRQQRERSPETVIAQTPSEVLSHLL